MRISRYLEHSFQLESAETFFNSFDGIIKESDEYSIIKIIKKVLSDLKLNTELALKFGTGIGACYPVVEKLMKNMNIDSFNLSKESIALLTICSFTIIYLEEKKYKSSEEEAKLTKDSKSMLEELKMMGIGNGIVKKIIKSIKSIKSIFSIIGKHMNVVVSNIVDMFAYTSLLVPILNGILSVIDKYNLNADTLTQNFIGLSVGISTIIAKNSVSELLNKLQSKFEINKKKVMDEIDTPTIQKFSSFGDSEKDKQSGELIKEQ